MHTIQPPIAEHQKRNARPNHQQPKRKNHGRVPSHRVVVVRPVDPNQEVLVAVVQQIAHHRIRMARVVRYQRVIPDEMHNRLHRHPLLHHRQVQIQLFTQRIIDR